jgi:hypothetical protein
VTERHTISDAEFTIGAAVLTFTLVEAALWSEKPMFVFTIFDVCLENSHKPDQNRHGTLYADPF